MKSYLQLFEYYKQLGEKAILQLSDHSSLFWTPSEESNSIAVIVQHLAGNMLSRWTDFLSSDGEKEWRDRDQEFELYLADREAMLDLWEKGWACLFLALKPLKPEQAKQLVYIRNKGHTIEEALQRQLGHYAYHVGQIVFLSRIIVGKPWNSLSIPKGESDSYNQRAFEGGKREEHFTEVFKDKEINENRDNKRGKEST